MSNYVSTKLPARLVMRGALAGMVLSAALAGTAQAETFQFRIGAGHPAVLPYVANLKNFFVPEIEKRIAAETEHKVRFVEAYGGSVAKLPEVLEAVQSGLLDFGGLSSPFEPSNLYLQNFAYHVPFAEPDAVKQSKIVNAVYEAFAPLDETMAAQNNDFLAILSSSDYNLVLTKPVKALADMNGLKIQAAGPNAPWLGGTGATPVQGSLNEVYNNMQTGVVEGMLIHLQGIKGFKLYEPGKSVPLVHFGSMPINMLTANDERLRKLPPEVREIVVQVAAEYEAMTNQTHSDLDVDALNAIREAGVSAEPLPKEELVKWAEAVKDVPEQAAQDGDKQGKPMRALLKVYLAEMKKAGVETPVDYVVK